MGFDLIYWPLRAVLTFCWVLIWKNMDNFGKTAVFFGQIWPDWGNTTRADLAGLEFIGLRYILNL